MASYDEQLQSEPNPTIVLRLMAFGALREGGRWSLSLATTLTRIARQNEGRFPVDAVADHLRITPHILDRLDDPDDVVLVAGEVVDIVRAHDRRGEPS